LGLQGDDDFEGAEILRAEEDKLSGRMRKKDKGCSLITLGLFA